MAWAVGLLLLLLAVAGVGLPTAADEPSQAALVVRFGEGQVETRCIPLEDEEMAGNDFLTRSGMDLVIDATSGLGITVCQIEDQGCAFPAEHCFCQCMGGEQCRYWNYFYREPGDEEWTYSPLGALLRQVQPGSVEAWVWGDGQIPPEEALTFEAICRPGVPEQPSPTPAPSNPTPRTGAGTATTGANAAPSAPATAPTDPPVATASTVAPSPPSSPAASPTPSSPGSTVEPAGYGVFGLLMLGLLLIGVVVWLRRR